ncbi:MAG: hypothetical protein C4293_13950 [Nitrospiraceae bacterium]
MTFAMHALFRLLPKEGQQPVPPRAITMGAAEAIGLKHHLDEPERLVLTLAAHFAYGTEVGTLYVPLAKRLPWPAPLKGLLFRLTVWAASYLGWVPVTEPLPMATEWPQRQNALMIAVHMVWGTTIAVVAESLRE